MFNNLFLYNNIKNWLNDCEEQWFSNFHFPCTPAKNGEIYYKNVLTL